MTRRGAAALLNTRLACEKEIARLQGLYDHRLNDGESGHNISITISRGQPPTSLHSSMPGDNGWGTGGDIGGCGN